MLTYCLEVAEKLAADGISAEVLDLRTIKPIDQAAIVATAKKTGKVLVVHEDTRFAGIAAEVMAIIMEHAFSRCSAHAIDRTGRAGHALQPRAGGGVHAERRPDPRQGEGAG